jgi:hypothetical protein
MSLIPVTKWLRLRAVFAVGVLVLVIIELTGHRSWPVVLVQALLIFGIVTTSLLDVRDLRRGRTGDPEPPSA